MEHFMCSVVIPWHDWVDTFFIKHFQGFMSSGVYSPVSTCNITLRCHAMKLLTVTVRSPHCTPCTCANWGLTKTYASAVRVFPWVSRPSPELRWRWRKPASHLGRDDNTLVRTNGMLWHATIQYQRRAQITQILLHETVHSGADL